MSNKNEYRIYVSDFKDHEDSGPWRSYDLEATGSTLDELLNSAVYWQTDQDGESMGDIPADDRIAQRYITIWFKQTIRESIERKLSYEET